MDHDQIHEAVAEAERRRRISDRDLSAPVQHFGSVIRSVCREWGLTVERWLPGGTGTPPLAVRLADGSAAVLKISEPGALDGAVRVLRADDGRAYARVLTWETDRGALVLERLGEALGTETSTLGRQAQVLVPLLREAWRVPLACGHPFQSKALELLAILADLGPRYGTGHEDVLVVATEYAEELAASERAEVVCHGDPHAGNVLRRGGGWALIDPDGFVGERAYDLGVVLRDACREIADAEAFRAGAARPMLREEGRRLAELANVDSERVWQWAFVERVTTGLYLRWYGRARESATFMNTATLLARSRQPGTARSSNPAQGRVRLLTGLSDVRCPREAITLRASRSTAAPARTASRSKHAAGVADRRRTPPPPLAPTRSERSQDGRWSGVLVCTDSAPVPSGSSVRSWDSSRMT